MLVEAPKTWCNGIGRYTLLRWAVNQDDDVWLSMRGTRHQQKCETCSLPGEFFPHGYYQPPLCESCIRSVELNSCFFFYCKAERAVKPCRSSRSSTRGGMRKSHDTCKTGNKHQNPSNKKPTTKQKTTGGKCQWMVRHVVKRK